VHGSLLEREYDHSLHGHTGWTVGALVVDVQRLIRFNVRYGFKVGDAVLREVVATLSRVFPMAKIVRTHTDAFAALFPPFSEQRVSESLRERVRAELGASVGRLAEEAEHQLEARATAPEGQHLQPPEGPRPEVGFTVAMLELEVHSPSHWQVLGPLVWAEAERALAVERLGEARGVQRRRIDLAGTL
jgi:GGDEF domain-containing protein